jgi:iron(III) transport system substrate-binding protein
MPQPNTEYRGGRAITSDLAPENRAARRLSDEGLTPGRDRSSVVGRLVVLSAAERRYCEGLIALFEAAHPQVELDFVFGISTDLHARYLAEVEAGGPTADLIWSSAMDLQMALVLSGHAQPHGSTAAASLPDEARHEDLACATTLEPLVTLVRRDEVPPHMRAGSSAELTKLIEAAPGRFRGRIACLDIERNGLGFLAMLQSDLEDTSFEGFLNALATCEPLAMGSAPPLVEAVTSGRAALALHVLGSYAQRAEASCGGALGIAASAFPVPAVSRIAFIPRRAANPGAARAFLDTLLSPDGQAALGAAGLYPILAPRPEGGVRAPRLDRSFERMLDPGRRESLLRRWRIAFGRTDPTSPNSSTGVAP